MTANRGMTEQEREIAKPVAEAVDALNHAIRVAHGLGLHCLVTPALNKESGHSYVAVTYYSEVSTR